MKRNLTMALFSLVSVAMLLGAAWFSSLKPTLAQGNRPAALVPTLVVGNDGDSSGLLCDTPSNCTLRSAINIANSNGTPDLIVFLTGTHVITLTGGVLPTLVETTTYISGVDPSLNPEIVKINANNLQNAFKISGYDIELDHLRIYGAGSGWSNIWVTGASRHVQISNDTIGSDDPFTGSCSLSPNSYGGIYIDATGPLGGDGRVYIYGDAIFCHGDAASQGISLHGTDHVVIGADPVGNHGPTEHNFISNNHEGIVIESGSQLNTVRNSDLHDNGDINVWITGSGTNFNVVQESNIYRAGNTGVQIDSGAQTNRIGSPLGGPTTSATVIYSNTREGLYISGVSTAYNLVFGNKIGVNSGGIQTRGNGLNGIVLDNGTHDNVIGSTSAEQNIIGGNGGHGIAIINGSHNNTIQANDIGAMPGYGVTLPNGLDGIYIASNATLNSIGDGTGFHENFIGGNAHYGVEITGGNTYSNSLLANLIGGGELAIPRPNGWDGLAMLNGTHGNTSHANWFDSNGRSGIYLAGGVHDNSFSNDIVRNNTFYGMILDGAGTQFNLIQYVHSYDNGYDGIGERNGANFNVWSHVNIYGNGGLGIDKFADYGDTANIVNAPPVSIIKVVQSSGSTTVDGTGPTGSLIELYQVAPDPSGFGEGKLFIGSATVSGGLWEIIDPSGGTCYTTIEIALGIVSTEFGANNCRTFLPLILKNH